MNDLWIWTCQFCGFTQTRLLTSGRRPNVWWRLQPTNKGRRNKGERFSGSAAADGLLDAHSGTAKTIFHFLPHEAGICGCDNLGCICISVWCLWSKIIILNLRGDSNVFSPFISQVYASDFISLIFADAKSIMSTRLSFSLIKYWMTFNKEPRNSIIGFCFVQRSNI